MTQTSFTPNIDIVIPLYINHVSLFPIVQRCLNSLSEHYPDFNQIVIDDDSPIRHGFTFAARNYSNSGFTHTVNQGLIRTTGDVIIVANDDLTFKAGDLDRFREIKGLGIYFPRDSASGNLDQFGAIWGMTRETYELLGNMDETYKHFYSDREYYERAKTKGVPIVRWDDICIEHHESATYKHADKESLLREDMEHSKRTLG